MVAVGVLFVGRGATAEPSIAFLGNSIVTYGSYDLPYFLHEFSSGDLDVEVSGIGGGSLLDHTTHGASLTLISEGKDHLVLVEGTSYLFNPAYATQDSAEELFALGAEEGSTPWLFMSYAHGDWDAQQREEVISGFTLIADELGVGLIPVADALGRAVDEFGSGDFYQDDQVHLKPDGHFLSACITYSTLLGVTPSNIEYSGAVVGLLHHEDTLGICKDVIGDYADPVTPGGTDGSSGDGSTTGDDDENSTGGSTTQTPDGTTGAATSGAPPDDSGQGASADHGDAADGSPPSTGEAGQARDTEPAEATVGGGDGGQTSAASGCQVGSHGRSSWLFSAAGVLLLRIRRGGEKKGSSSSR